MGITWLEVCLISAHGLQHSTSLWKRQWFAVGWIDYNSKYCTKVDDSENGSPVWRTILTIPVDDSVPNFRDSALNVEVYSIEPIFLMEKLHGSTTVVLREFLDKEVKDSEESQLRHAEVRSYQLRKKNASKPRGFIDISIRVHEVKKEPKSQSGGKGGMVPLNGGNNTHFSKGGLGQAYPQKHPQYSYHQEENHEERTVPDFHSMPFPAINHADPYDGEPSYDAVAGPSNEQLGTQTPPPPPQLSNGGYIPTFLTRNDCLPPRYTDMPPPRKPPGGPTTLAMELGAGTLAAGALIFGDDFMSGFEVSPGLGDDYLIKEINPPF
ncbi:hypothetical protein HN51_059222 [Arachis hypogaea]|uniref:C2 domain-containing protein n=1 Tax=Arachis hypogaea TaxID=3818 RepID=A0A444X4K4_ARAHY|nr:hypothetical protein Ahy_B10g104039 [Arachis hypogaea]